MSPDQKILHVLSRLTYGPAPGDVERVRDMGVAAFIAEQLEPDAIPQSKALAARLEALPTTRLGAVELFREYGPTLDKAGGLGPSQVLAARDRAGVVSREAVEARLLRAVADPAQLRELLTDFWYNHFNVDAGKGLARIWAGAYEREAIRPYVLGRFLDLLAATAMHPAMLIALDNWRNVAPRGEAAAQPSAGPAAQEPPHGDDRRDGAPAEGDARGIDTTYAATLLSVHTLGQATAFSADDVTALARVFTGWRIGAPRSETDKNGFVFDQTAHDPTDKTFLGATIQGGGMAEGAAALRFLAAHEATARHVCRRLAAFFLAGEPSPGLTDRLSGVFVQSGGEIRAVLAALFSDAEFFDEKRYGAGFKSPLRHVVSAVRATGAMPDDPTPLADVLARMGAPLFHCPDPAGYALAPSGPPTARDMAARVVFSADLVSGRLPLWTGRPVGLAPTALLAALGRTTASHASQTTGAKAPEKAASAGKKAAKAAAARATGRDDPGLDAAAILAGPDFVRY
ncbi:MAG: DUF1800 domain-containing protein [Desulfovibrionaceae bacterium]|nr:DUF1800 domain-containing protein [Desulfovibrionaceae bacterium]